MTSSQPQPLPMSAMPILRVHEWFEVLADRQPSAPALVSDRGVLTYRELEQRANALAHALLGPGMTKEEPVGVLAGRSESLPVAFLATLKAGGVYVPMGADLPPLRLAAMATQAGMRRLIALDGLEVPPELLMALAGSAESAPVILRPEEPHRDDRRPVVPGNVNDLVAVLFTSGSTGQPKGVLIQHDACVNMAQGHIAAHGISSPDRVLLGAAPGYIMGFRQLCLPLLSGAALVPVSRAVLDAPADLLTAMARHRVTVAMFTPSYLRLFHGAAPAGLRCLLTAGEPPDAAIARAYARQLEYWNVHGATETCGTFCMSRVDPDSRGPLPSGRPFANTAVHLLNGDGQEVAPGEVGEVHVVGVGVARGYLALPELTASRFVASPYGRAYRSGDLGRWNEDGDLEPSGRADDAVKISGQYVSTAEVEQTLLRHRAVTAAAVLQHDGKLVAFVEGSSVDRLSLEEWHLFLGKTLPAYMLPTRVTVLSGMPLNAVGKADRGMLLALAEQASRSRATRGSPPLNEVERRIARVWEESLGVRAVMREDNYFSLGGTSLMSIAISQRLQALGYAASTHDVLLAGTVAALAARMARNGAPIQPDPPARQGLATAGQEDYWIARELGLTPTASQVTRVLAVRGVVPEPSRWQKAWAQLMARHAAMRTAFFAGPGGQVFWRTKEPDEPGLGGEISLDDCDSLEEAQESIAARCNAPFRLTEPPLARAGLMQVDRAGETLFWFTLHHSVVDGLSARIVEEELHSLLVGGSLPPAPNGIALASQAERRYLASDQAEPDRVFWEEKLEALLCERGGEAFDEFPTDHRRPENPSGKPSTRVVERLEAGTVDALAAMARAHEVGLYAVLMTLLAVEARRRVGRADLLIGATISPRPVEADRAVGCFVNPLPLVLAKDTDSRLSAQIRSTQAALSEAMEHGAYPSSLLYRRFRQRNPRARSHARASLFDVCLTAAPSQACGDGSLSLTPRRLPGELTHPAAGLDLAFSYEPIEGGGLELALAWNPDVYRRETAQRWLSSLAAWARWVAEDASRAQAPLPALLPAEEQCLARWERGRVHPRPAKRFHELFEDVVDRHPDRAAVVTDFGVQRYADLERRANRIAQALLDHGVAREEPVAVLTECSADLPATVLAIWKSGAAYLPLALEQPPARLAYLARDAGARTLVVLDGHEVPGPLREATEFILRPEALGWNTGTARPGIGGTPQDLAYVIYTSGTSGTPKGVLIQHDSLINASYASCETYGLTAEDRFSLVATPGFDASLWELGATLLCGMSLVPVSRALRDDPWALKHWYKTHGVTVAFHTPSYLRVSKQTRFEGLRVLITGGEAPSHDDARQHANDLALWNAYGPTETTIFVCAEPMTPHPDASRPLPVGRPIPNTRISIRGAGGQPVPPGVVGEVWLSGAGLARGYLNQPELTAERFVDAPDGRFYRSGDLGRWTGDGLLELAGRHDDQIKWHGQRVELGEIEHALLSHPAVEEAVVLVKASEGEKRTLRAFVRLRPAVVMPAESEWRTYLGDRLPMHMVPATVTSVAAIPLKPTGKVDRDALLLSSSSRASDTARSLPSGELELRIAALWKELLGDDVSREDNFFALGGNSLLAVTMAHRLSHEIARAIPARELFAAPTLAGFAQRVALLRPPEAPTAPCTRSDLATEGQREFWVAEAAGLDTRTFNMPLLRKVEGSMPSLERWNGAWASLVARHEALRTFFREDAEGRLRRAALPRLAATLETATQPSRSAARSFVRKRQGVPFAMSVPPLWRAGLIEVADSREHLFWLALHHSVGDGHSLGIILEELSALLRGEALPPLASEFAQSAGRGEAYLAGPACGEDARFWADLLDRQPASIFDEGPLDFPRSIAASTGTHRFETRLGGATTKGLRALARQHGATVHALMLTLLALEARRRAGRADVVLGSTASLRETAAEGQVVGYYVNMLPLPSHPARHRSFGEALRDTQQTLAAGLQHARYPFARMYHDFWSKHLRHRHPARYPLFDLAVTESPESRADSQALRLARVSEGAQAVTYELTDASPGEDVILIHEALADGDLVLQLQANAALYTRETARGWFEALRGWATWLAEDPVRAGEALPALLPGEAAMLAAWEEGPQMPRPRLGFHQLFERILDTGGATQADRPAILTENSTTSYAALEREANAIAHGLRERGVGPGRTVGVLSERSAGLPAAILGIWKAGAIYLPLSADLPPERLALMARDARIVLLLALDKLEVPPALGHDVPPPLRPEELDAEFRRAHGHRPPPAGGPTDAAYIIYTSGSTGLPKGILIGHDAYVNALLGAGENLGLTRDDRCLLFSSPSFDVSLSDIGLPLAFGAALCPLSHSVLGSPNRFRDFLTKLAVTVADVTPTYLRLLDGAELPSLRILVTGGEAPVLADVRTYASRLLYFNAYGPTENTITSTMGRLSPEDGDFLSVGRPLANTSVHVCDRGGNPVPPGVVGELWLGGAGLARAYLGRPDLTAAAFVETDRGRRYRSGDLGRWRPTGELEIHGRTDDQVKLNGIRIELGEIEHALAIHPLVAQAAALLDGYPGRNQSLWAFVRPLTGKDAPPEESWPKYLASRLPAYMIPSAVLTVPRIPCSASGKVDRGALRKLLAGRSPSSDKAPPEEGLEAEIAQVWSDLLGRGPVHRDDSFFALGGNSLLAIAVAHRLENALGHPVPARELFAEPTLRGFARRVGELGRTPSLLPVQSDRATEGQRDFWIAEQAGLDTRGFIVPLTLVARGAVPPDAQWRRAWAALVIQHEALRTGFHIDADGVLRRSIVPELDASLAVSTAPDMPTALAEVKEHQLEPFAMDSPPLWRAGLVHIDGTGETVFWLALHHSVVDGASLRVLAEELSTLLHGGSLPAVTDSFDRAAGEEERYLASPDREKDALYWRRTLSFGAASPDVPGPFDEWPLDLPRPLARTRRNTRGVHCFHIRLPLSTAAGLRALARRSGASVHALMLTLMALEVRRRTGRPEFLLGTAASTRGSATEARTLGYYLNMLPLPCRVGSGEPVERTLQTMQRNLAEALRHARYPFACMLRDFRADHSQSIHPARHPLFDVAVTENPGVLVVPSTDSDLRLGAVSPADVGYELRPSGPAPDMVLAHEDRSDGSLDMQWFVNAAIYEKDTAEAWIGSLAGWARLLADGQRPPDSPAPALLPEEEALLARWEHGPALPQAARSFPARFEEWARVQPGRPALLTDRGAQSYATINARANALAHALLARGVARQEPVGVFTDRSLALPETALGIWKAGGCLVPLVKDLPDERLAFIARDAGIRILLVLDGHEPPAALVATGCKVFRPQHLAKAFRSSHRHPVRLGGEPLGGQELACILYTSGSTGVPKGVMLHHQGLINLGTAAAAALDIRRGDRSLLMASPAFDLWTADLVTAWTAGAAVVPVERREVEDLAVMQDKLTRLRVTTAAMTPSYLRLFDQSDFPSLRLLITVGEPPRPADALHYASRLRYVNGYGPTENSAATSFGLAAANARQLTAGRPLANTSVHILGRKREPVPPGSLGEVWLGGMGLASGYLNSPDLTAASFVETPLGRLYRTGDLGRWTQAGELQILGRSDGQVKLRGQRIELAEIEHRLGDHPGVKQAAAALSTLGDGAHRLWGFVCLEKGASEPTQKGWRDHLAETLPAYMLPSAVVSVPAIPVNLSGKVDRAALLRAVPDAEEDGRRGTPPRGGMEQHIAEVWAEHLGCRSISREDSFFDLGGDSLRVISVVNKLRRTCHCNINDLYERPRLADFAATCRDRPEHLRTVIRAAVHDWKHYRHSLPAYESEREAVLSVAHREYEARNQRYCDNRSRDRRDYGRVLLTGATGYLGSYLLRELLGNRDRQVSALIRGPDEETARHRLGETLCHYFGPERGSALRDDPRLRVLAGDLRRDDLGLPSQTRDHLADGLQAIFHCAANVRHFGHHWEFQEDNVAATARLLQLAAHRTESPADFHLVSTISVCDRAPESGFRLFTEYDIAPEISAENYYLRTKQEAERLAVAARHDLANVCIHRVGNLVFAADGGPLQINIHDNAFFRLVAAFLRLGVAPDDSHLWLSHVDVVARGLLLLAGAADLTNETHHLENAHRQTLASFVSAAGVRACSFGAFLKRLEAAVDEPGMEGALAEILETCGLYRGRSPQARARRLEIASGRTQILLSQLGLSWPPASALGQAELLREAAGLFTPSPSERSRHGGPWRPAREMARDDTTADGR